LKNTLVIDLDAGCAIICLEKLADNTNRLFIEARSQLYNAPIFNLLADGYSKIVDYEKNNGAFKFRIPEALIFNTPEFEIAIGGIDRVTTVYFLNQSITENGNLFIRQQSERGYILRCSVKNATGVPVATKHSLGVVRIGEGLDIEPDGTLDNPTGNLESLSVTEINNILI